MAMTHVYTRLTCALMTATALFIVTGAQAQVPSAKTTVAATTSPMVRNGDGVRSQGATDLYRAALYLSQPANSLDQLLQVARKAFGSNPTSDSHLLNRHSGLNIRSRMFLGSFLAYVLGTDN